VSSTVGDLVDRVYREYLEPVDKVESYSYLSSGINDSVDSITYDGNLFSIEEEDALDAGAIVEVGQELMYTTALNASANTITVKRGQRGTTNVAHLAGDLIKIAPAFPRKNVYEAIVDQVKNLYPTLFATETLELVASTGYKLLGTHGSNVDNNNYLITPLKAISQYTDWQAGSDQTGLKYNGVAIEMIDLPNPFVYTDDTSTERTKTYTTGPNVVHAVQFVGIAAGHTVFVTFKKKFVTPTAETTTLSSIGLETEYEPIVMTGTAAQLIAGKDISKLNTSYITEQLESSVSPIGSSNSIGNSLLRYQQLLIQQARSNLRSKYPEPVQLNSILYPT
tara:strand:+ start:14968 stop:15975 length:1008 start_codon:yes stop_codon:yes gene_type:complete